MSIPGLKANCLSKYTTQHPTEKQSHYNTFHPKAHIAIFHQNSTEKQNYEQNKNDMHFLHPCPPGTAETAEFQR